MFAYVAESLSIFASVGSIFETIFGGDEPKDSLELHQVAARAVSVYLFGVILVRLGKSRMLSRATTLDVLIGFILGSLLSRGITGYASMSGTMVASLALVAAHWSITWLAWRSHWLGNLIKGHSVQIVKDGEALTEVMRRSHISDHDLEEHLRLQGVADIAQVKEAYKERNGEISVIERDSVPRVIDVNVKDGVQTVRIAFG